MSNEKLNDVVVNFTADEWEFLISAAFNYKTENAQEADKVSAMIKKVGTYYMTAKKGN